MDATPQNGTNGATSNFQQPLPNFAEPTAAPSAAVVTVPAHQHRYDKEQKLTLVRLYQSSTLTHREFAKTVGVNIRTFEGWIAGLPERDTKLIGEREAIRKLALEAEKAKQQRLASTARQTEVKKAARKTRNAYPQVKAGGQVWVQKEPYKGRLRWLETLHFDSKGYMLYNSIGSTCKVGSLLPKSLVYFYKLLQDVE
jgi:transposase-like protein